MRVIDKGELKMENEWEAQILGDLIETNKTSIGKNYKHTSIKYLDTGSITENEIEKYQDFDLKGAPSRAKRLVKENDIVYSTVRPNQRHYGLIKKPFDNLVVSTGFTVISCLENQIDAEYLYYYLTRNQIVNYLQVIAEGSTSTYPSLKPSDIENLVIELPPLLQQKQIATILSTLDQKIALLKKQNQTLEELAQTLFKRWFVDFEFPNEQGLPYKRAGGKMIPSELGEIPEGWSVGSLGEEFNILMGQSPSGSSYNESGKGKIFYQGRTDFKFRFPTNRLFTTEPKRMAEKFDVLISVRAPVGDINMANEECCIGRGLASVKSEYKSYCFNKLKSMKTAFDVFESEGTVFGSLSKNDFNDLSTIIPSKEIVVDFETKAFSFDFKIFNNSKEIQTLTQLRDTLLPKLMSGSLEILSACNAQTDKKEKASHV